jgi:hypothetical protein
VLKTASSNAKAYFRILFVICALTLLGAGFAPRVHGQSTEPEGNLAPKPLFRDPVNDGAADPTLIWNRDRREWWMFYTNRRADLPGLAANDVSWVHGTRIGIAVSRDHGAT